MRTYLRRALQSYRESARYEPVLNSATPPCAGISSMGSGGTEAEDPLSTARLAKYYKLNATALPTSVQHAYHPLAADGETQDFLHSCKPNWCTSFFATILRCFYSITDTNAILRRGQMFVISKEHARELLPTLIGPGASPQEPGNPLRLLDVGAGDGGVTSKLAPFFDSITVTEVSKHMGTRLRERGYEVHVTPFLTEDIFPRPQVFDVVSIFNVLDRCDHPYDMLRCAIRLMKPQGRLVLAVVLPFSEFVEEGTRRRPVLGPLPMKNARCGDGASFEASLSALIGRVLLPLGLEIERIAKVPYLCRGDSDQPYYVLSDAILVCRLAPAGVNGSAFPAPRDQFADQLLSSGGPLAFQKSDLRATARAIDAPTALDIDSLLPTGTKP